MYNSRKMNRSKDQWRSREYGFVDFCSRQEADAAIARYHGCTTTDLVKEGCALIAQYAKTVA